MLTHSMSSRMRHAAAAVLLALLAAAASARASVLYVDDDAPLSGDGQAWPTACRYLQDALHAAAQPGSTVTVIRIGQGVYTPDMDEGGLVTPGDRNAFFDLTDGPALVGGYAGYGAPIPDARDIDLYETILSGDLNGDDGPNFVNYDDNSMLVTGAYGTMQLVQLDGLTIRAGAADPGSQSASGLRTSVAPVWVRDCTFEANLGDWGGGARLGGYAALIENTSFVGNRALWGAGIYVSDSQEVTIFGGNFTDNVATGAGGAINLEPYSEDAVIDGCTFTGNAAGGEGGVVASFGGGSADFFNSTFEQNSAGASGGVVSMWGGGYHFADCVFRGNEAIGKGGVAYFDEGGVSFVRCRFFGNTAASRGGALCAEEGFGDVTNCTFYGNTAAKGGALFLDSDSYMSQHTATNCLFVGNYADEHGGAIVCVGAPPGAPSVADCTFTENSAGEMGGAVHFTGSWTVQSKLANSVLWSNHAPLGHEIAVLRTPFTDPIAAEVAYCLVQGGLVEVHVGPGELLTWAPGNIDTDPLFRLPPDPGPDGLWGTADDDPGDLRLAAGSPCIDAADNTRVLPDIEDLDGDGDMLEPVPFDLTGAARFVDDPDTPDTGFGDPPLVDIGAYEFQTCPADVNGDATVDVLDLLAVLAAWGVPGGAEDINGDGIVNVLDLLEILSAWGPC